MSKFEFLSYTPTPQEKHIGIATVKIYDKIILRYKIIPNKDGSGFFAVSSSLKISDDQGERYLSSFMLDSNSENEELVAIVRANVKKQIQETSTHSTQSNKNGFAVPYPLPHKTYQPESSKEENFDPSSLPF